MITVNPQYINDTAGKKLVVLPAKEFNNIMQELEDLEDVKRYDAAKKRKQSYVDAEKAFKQIEAKEKRMYSVKIEKAVQKSLEKINEPSYSKIKLAILNLAKNPRPQRYKKLKGRDGFRIRVADYRIIYDILDNILLVEVIDLGHRSDIYE